MPRPVVYQATIVRRLPTLCGSLFFVSVRVDTPLDVGTDIFQLTTPPVNDTTACTVAKAQSHTSVRFFNFRFL